MSNSTVGIEEERLQKIEELFVKQKKFSRVLRSSTAVDRINKLKKLKKWITDHLEDIQKSVYQDFKKPPAEVDLTESYVVINEINHSIKNLKDWMKPESIPTPLLLLPSTGKLVYEPKGSCLIISPWNFPFNLAIGPLVSAIAAGNTVILKPSEISPNTSTLISSMISELFQENEVAAIQGGIEVSQHLLSLPFDHIFFTGSTEVGKVVMRAAADNLASVTLELGGKSPAIIHSDADVKDAARKLAWGKFINNGQTCIAPDYVMVHQDHYENFLESIALYVDQMFGDSKDDFLNSDSYARIISSRHFDRLRLLLEEAIEDGANVYLGGVTNEEEKFISPTVLTDLSINSTLMKEEIFGPILPVLMYSDITEVIETINAMNKPLSLYLFTSNQRITSRLTYETSAGAMVVNENVLHFLHAGMPFGGANHSGIGKSHGFAGFKAFSNEKPVLKNYGKAIPQKLLHPPYDKLTQRLINLIVKYF